MYEVAATQQRCGVAARSPAPAAIVARFRQPPTRQLRRAALQPPSIRRCQKISASAQNSVEPIGEDDTEGLLADDDEEIPGTYRDAMSGNTPLGKAIRGACDELDALGALELAALTEAEALLQSVGYAGSLFAAPSPTDAEGDLE